MLLSDATLYWLLEVAVRRCVPLDTLLPGTPPDLDHFSIVFNRDSHDLNKAQLEEVLHTLFTGGLLLAWDGATIGDTFAPVTEGFVPTREQIHAALADRAPEEDPLLLYGLSAARGERWEHFARPDWARFVDHEEGEFDSPPSSGQQRSQRPRQYVQLICADRAQIEMMLAQDRDRYRIIDPSTIEWSEWYPWNATYWKQLPAGWQVRYLFWAEAELRTRGAVISRYRQMDDLLYCRKHLLDRKWNPTWYTDPFTGEAMQ